MFAVTGASKALGPGLGAAVAVILGAVSGVGGGTLRDVLLGRIPSVLRRGLYALPALCAAVITVAAVGAGIYGLPAAAGAVLACFLIQVLGVRYDLNAPMAPEPAQRTAATSGDRSTARDYAAEAAAAAGRVGPRGSSRLPAFGPAGVTLYQVSIAQVLGDSADSSAVPGAVPALTVVCTRWRTDHSFGHLPQNRTWERGGRHIGGSSWQEPAVRQVEGLVGNCSRKEDIAATPLNAKPLIPTAGSRRRSPPQGPRDRLA